MDPHRPICPDGNPPGSAGRWMFWAMIGVMVPAVAAALVTVTGNTIIALIVFVLIGSALVTGLVFALVPTPSAEKRRGFPVIPKTPSQIPEERPR